MGCGDGVAGGGSRVGVGLVCSVMDVTLGGAVEDGRVMWQKRKRLLEKQSLVWRRQDSNLRPLGYEPNELPLLHSAICGAKVVRIGDMCKYIGQSAAIFNLC